MIAAAELVRLERLAVSHGLTLRDPRDPEPDLTEGCRVWTMNHAGELAAAWCWPGDVRWWEVRAWRAEDDLGRPVCELEPLEEEMDGELEVDDDGELV